VAIAVDIPCRDVHAAAEGCRERQVVIKQRAVAAAVDLDLWRTARACSDDQIGLAVHIHVSARDTCAAGE
jgi:hypothetical protein